MRICRYDKDANPNSCAGCEYGCLEKKPAAYINREFEDAVKEMEANGMNVDITPRKTGERGGIICLPLVANVPSPKTGDWKKVICPKCGAACWESELARQVITSGTAAACTMCALKAGIS